MRRLILLPLALLGLATLGLASAGAFPTVHQADASAVGVIVKLTPTSISVGRHEHHRRTCNLGASSPSTALFAVGDRVKIACAADSLVAIADIRNARKSDHDAAPGTTTPAEPVLTYAVGPITARSDASLSVQTMTCTVGPGSPSTAGFIVGTLVRMYCKDGVLVALKRSDDGPPATTTVTTTSTTQPVYTAITGTVGTLGSTSITVNGGDDGHASLMCTITADSPSTSGFPAGTRVRMYCKNGVLFSLSRVDAPTTSTTTTTTSTTTAAPPPVYAGISGTIAALGSTSIAVNRTSGDGPLSLACTIGSGSPSTSGFAVGSSVRMYCKDGGLYILQHADAPPAGTTTTAATNTTTTTTTTTIGGGTTGQK